MSETETTTDDFYVLRVPRQLMDREEHRRALALPRQHEAESHPCPIEGCHITAEEHHRIAFGYMAIVTEYWREHSA